MKVSRPAAPIAQTKRLTSLLLLVGTIGLGLLSRSSLVPVSSIFGQYAGDTLWAMAVYWTVSVVFPCACVWQKVVATLGFAFAIELSQLCQSEWLNHLRSYQLGALILGHGFLWSDLACYTAGGTLTAVLDHRWARAERPSFWQWYLHSTLKDKLIIFGITGLGGTILLWLLNVMAIKLLGASMGCLLVGLVLRPEDSTNI